MTAPEIADLVTAAVALIAAITAYLHSRVTRSIVTSSARHSAQVPNGQDRSTNQR